MVLKQVDEDVYEKLDAFHLRTQYARIELLDFNEHGVGTIEGKISTGNVSVNGSSAIRRTINLTMIADARNSSVESIENEISINRKVRVFVGMDNPIEGYEPVAWFKLGTFILSSASVSHSTSGWTISISGKDKMAMLDGTAGGTLPAATVFHEREIIAEDGSVTIEYPTIYQIIYEAVNHWGGEQENKIFISDLDETCRLLVRYIGEKPIYFNNDYTAFTNKQGSADYPNKVIKNQDAGYKITPFTYPGELVLSAGETVVSLLDKIKNVLSNFEYFYDVDGNFHFQQIKNYLNTASPLNELDPRNYVKSYNNEAVVAKITSRDISSISIAPKYENIKNDYIVWGTVDNKIIHYHLAIDKKPAPYYFYKNMYEVAGDGDTKSLQLDLEDPSQGTLIAVAASGTYEWREELYRKALAAQYNADDYIGYYSPELLSWWRELYDPTKWEETEHWNPAVKDSPETLTFWLDFIDTDSQVGRFSVPQIGRRSQVENSDKIKTVYNREVPDVVFVSAIDTTDQETTHQFKLTDYNMNLFQASYTGVSCFDKIRELLYQHLVYNTTISISCLPRYYLEPNTMIAIEDKGTGIKGNYQITQFSLPLAYNGMMSITATEVLNRI